MSAKKIEIVVPGRLFELLEQCERKSGARKEDLLMRALIKVIEEFGVKVG
jgi:hypothetical protein